MRIGNSAAEKAATALLKASAGSSAEHVASSPLGSGKTGTPAKSFGPATKVDLSDRAKAMLERNKVEQAVADKIDHQLAAAKNNSMGSQNTKAKNHDGLKLFVGSADGTNGTGEGGLKLIGGNADGARVYEGIGSFREKHMDALWAANTRPDGTITRFVERVDNVIELPSQEEMEERYRLEVESQLRSQHETPWSFEPDRLKAAQEKNIKIQSALDIPDLNFKNTIIFEGGEGGGSVNNEWSYNKDSSIFNDPNMHFRVSSNGMVESWPKSSAVA